MCPRQSRQQQIISAQLRAHKVLTLSECGIPRETTSKEYVSWPPWGTNVDGYVNISAPGCRIWPSSLHHNILSSFCYFLVLWNLFTISFLFVTSSLERFFCCVGRGEVCDYSHHMFLFTSQAWCYSHRTLSCVEIHFESILHPVLSLRETSLIDDVE